MREADFIRRVEGRGAMRLAVLWGRIVGIAPKTIAIITAITVGVGFTEGAGLGLLLPLLSLVGVSTRTNPSEPTERVARLLDSVGIPIDLGWVLGLFLVVGLLQVGFQSHQKYLLVYFREALQLRLRKHLYRQFSRASWRYQADERAAQFSNAIITEVPRVGAAAGHVVNALGIVVTFLFYLAVSAWISWQFTLLLSVCGGSSFLLLRRILRASHRLGEGTYNASTQLQEVMNEQLAASKVIHASNAWECSRALLGRAAEALMLFQTRINLHTVLVNLLVQPLALVFIVIVIFVGIRILALPPADLIVLLVIFYRLSPRMAKLQEILQRTASLLPSYEQLGRISAELSAAVEPEGGRPFMGLTEGIRLDGVSVRLEGVDVLTDVDLTIPSNSLVALVGPSGSGKSTVLDLVSGLRTPDAGTITIDGAPLSEFDLGSLRDRIGLVTQQPAFFNATIRENIHFLAPETDDSDIWHALDQVGLTDFVCSRPKGLDTVLGDQGLRLSGGQLQRLDIARALLRRPAILLLDEPTSALDGEARDRIQQLLRDLQRSMSIVFVTHDEAFARNANVVYRFAGGRLNLAAGRTAAMLDRP